MEAVKLEMRVLEVGKPENIRSNFFLQHFCTIFLSYL